MYYIYKILDINDVVLYVGKTNNIARKVMENKTRFDWSEKISKIYYYEFEMYGDSLIYQAYFTQKYKSHYNRLGTECSVGTSISLPELEWVKYNKKTAVDRRDDFIDNIRRNMSINNKWNASIVSKKTGLSLNRILQYFKNIGSDTVASRNKEAVKEAYLQLVELSIEFDERDIVKLSGVSMYFLEKSGGYEVLESLIPDNCEY